MSPNPYDPPLSTKSADGTVRLGGRPTIISVVCVVIAVSLARTLAALPTMANRLADVFGLWFAAIWIVSLIAAGTSIVGCWRMKRWGVYLYTASFVVGPGIGLAMGLPFTVLDGLVPILFIALGFAYIGRMG